MCILKWNSKSNRLQITANRENVEVVRGQIMYGIVNGLIFGQHRDILHLVVFRIFPNCRTSSAESKWMLFILSTSADKVPRPVGCRLQLINGGNQISSHRTAISCSLSEPVTNPDLIVSLCTPPVKYRSCDHFHNKVHPFDRISYEWRRIFPIRLDSHTSFNSVLST